ncbi:DUF6615 family protein [Caulobacter sp. LjRoot300]|uniref:DUF6615 family protein n=1 Tax=Caulobacter sp. LjRoot300 TaxID=3342321 RepID=UPI003ECC5031
MTLAPLFDSPCDLAERIPAMVSDFLDLENRIGRRFREDSVSDIIIASLLKIAGSNATVLVPSEPKTGSDFDILLHEPATRTAVQYRIQAKRLYPHAKTWDWGSYRELDHPHGQGKQASTLVRSSAQEMVPTIPLYAFYNPQSACGASSGAISGIELADGLAINQIVKALVAAKAASKRPRLKRIAYLRDLFFPLSTILCPPFGAPTSGGLIVRPEVSRQAVQGAIASRARPDWMDDEEVPRLPGDYRHGLALAPGPLAPPQPPGHEPPGRERPADATRRLPLIVERAIARLQEGERIQSARVQRLKLILISRDGGP